MKFTLNFQSKNYAKAITAAVLALILLPLLPAWQAFALGAVLLVLSFLAIRSERFTLFLNLLWLCFACTFTLIASQPLAEGSVPWHVDTTSAIVGLLLTIVLVVLPVAVSGRFGSAFVGIGLICALCIVNGYVFRLRGSAFVPMDFLNAGTALDVISGYSLLPSRRQLYALAVVCLIVYSYGIIPHCNLQNKFFTRTIMGAVCIVCCLGFGLKLTAVHEWSYNNHAAVYNCYLANFCRQVQHLYDILHYKDYQPEYVRRLEQSYSVDEEGSEDTKPTIIVIMNESYADLRIPGELKTNTPIMPFLDSLHENTIRGYALASIFGGGTANSEYEFLTGNSLLFYPDMFMYQVFVKQPMFSIAWDLKRLGYQTLATHPNVGTNWSRNQAWPCLGFSQSTFIEDYTGVDTMRELVSDRGMYDYIIRQYEQLKDGGPLFLYGVTMQNHGGYSYSGNDITPGLTAAGALAADRPLEQYLGLIHESDRALQALIGYFQEVKEPVVIAFYGDHMPWISDNVYDTIHGDSYSTLDEQQLKYTVPFFIWANYDIEEHEIPLTSLNYLSGYVYEAAGLPKPPYLQFLEKVEQQIPALNSQGYYSCSHQCFLPLSDASGSEKEILTQYHILAHDSLLNNINRSKIFFPTGSQ